MSFFELFQPGARHAREERDRQKSLVATPKQGPKGPLGIDLEKGTASIPGPAAGSGAGATDDEAGSGARARRAAEPDADEPEAAEPDATEPDAAEPGRPRRAATEPQPAALSPAVEEIETPAVPPHPAARRAHDGTEPA